MASCPYCLETIAENARKCRYCHSLLGADAVAAAAAAAASDKQKTDKDERKKDAAALAELVIKFVGVGASFVGAFGVIAAILLAVFGYQYYKDLKNEIKTKNDEQSAELRKENEKQADEIRTSLVDFGYERYARVMDGLLLYAIPELTRSELEGLLKRAQALRESTKNRKGLGDSLAKIDEMEAVIEAVGHYRRKEYEHALWKIGLSSASSAARYRVLCSIYSQLALQGIKQMKSKVPGNPDQLKTRLDDLDACTIEYRKLSPRSNIANSLRAAAHMRKAYVTERQDDRNDKIRKGLYEEAIKRLEQAEELERGRSHVSYNLAACHVGLGDFDKAIAQLNNAKARGDFATEDDVTYFREDPDFEALHGSTDPEIVRAIAELVDLKSKKY